MDIAENMKLKIQFLCSTICLITVAMPAHADPPEMVPPTSDEWNEIYDPPTKVPTEIQAGSKLRNELFGLLHAKASPASHFLGSLKSFRNWAFFIGRTVDKSGKSIKNPPHGNDDAVALWLRTENGWVLVTHSFGHSDAFFMLWPEQYGTPRELLGMRKPSTSGGAAAKPEVDSGGDR